MGPVLAQQIIEKLYSGEIDGRTEVAPVGQSRFLPMKEIDLFRGHLAKAEVKLKAEAAAKESLKKAKRKRNLYAAAVAGVALGVGGIAASVAQYLAVHRGSDGDELAMTMETPTITASRPRAGGEELFEYPGSSLTRRPEKVGRSLPGGEKPSQREGTGKPAPDTLAEADGLAIGEVDKDAIDAVVASRKQSLRPCFVEEVRRTPGLSAKIPIEFVVGNEGRVTKLWVDNPTFKQGPLADCLFKELQKWPFVANKSQGASVRLSFTIGRGG